MKKIFFALFTLFISSNMMAADLNCSMSNGMLKYRYHSYSGRAAPGPGMQSSRIEWFFNSSTVFLARTYFSDGETEHETDPVSNIVWEEVAGSKQVLLEEGGPNSWFTRTVYATKILLKSSEPGQNMTGMGWEQFEGWFICDHMNAMYP